MVLGNPWSRTLEQGELARMMLTPFEEMHDKSKGSGVGLCAGGGGVRVGEKDDVSTGGAIGKPGPDIGGGECHVVGSDDLEFGDSSGDGGRELDYELPLVFVLVKGI